MDLLEVGKEALDVIERMRSFGVPGQLHAPPRRMRLDRWFRHRFFRGLFGLHFFNLN
jgi:hypothetical protein